VLLWWKTKRERILDLRTRASSSLLVRERDGHRELVETAEREMVHTRVRVGEPLISGFPYTDAMHAARSLSRVKPKRALCLGGGGFLIPQQLVVASGGGRLEVDAVEHAEDVIDLAREHFIQRRESFTIHCADADDFLNRATNKSYELAFIDLFGPFEASSLLASVGFFEKVARALTNGGAIAVNMVGALDGSNGAMLATTQAMHVAFHGQVLTLPMLSPEERRTQVLYRSEPRNVIAFATKGRLPESLQPMSSATLPALDDALVDINRQLRALAFARTGGSMRLVFV
jgi:spermidine synthase